MRALLVVDVQNDFIPGGSLGVAGGDRIVPTINKYVEEFERLGELVVYTRDWHPANHVSFKEQGGTWPAHCVQGTRGAELHKDLLVRGTIFNKGMNPRLEEYSAAGSPSSPLVGFLHGNDVTQIYVCGIATDYCVKQHVVDLLKPEVSRGAWRVFVLWDAVAAVNVKPGDDQEALRAMMAAGAGFMELSPLPAQAVAA